MGRVEFNNIPKDHQNNIKLLTSRVNKLLKIYGSKRKINDGYRRPQDTPKGGSPTSWHYKGAAIDIDDDDNGNFALWCLDHLEIIKDCELYMEDPRWTNGCGSWVHLQIYPPRSGKRVFIPSATPPCNPTLWDGKYDSSLNSN